VSVDRSAHAKIVSVIVLFLLVALTAAPQPRACKPQLAPMETATSSGAARDIWRKEEAKDWGGRGWLGWTREGDTLEPVSMAVRDSSSDVDEVHVRSTPQVTFAVRCVQGLRAGTIQNARVVNHDLLGDGALHVSLGPLRYEVRLETKDSSFANAQVVLAYEGRTQVLYATEGFADDPHFEIVWAGDLDRDGKLDLIVNLHRKYSAPPYRLLLSTRASRNNLVGEAAVFETGD
jgi:hypothetical protein